MNTFSNDLSSERGVAAPFGDFAAANGPAQLGQVLRHAISVVRRNIWLLMSIVAGFLIAAVIFTMLQTPRYTAEATVEISDQSAQVLGNEMDNELRPTGEWDFDRFLQTQLDIVRSRSLAERVAQRLNLNGSNRFFAAMQAPKLSEISNRQERGEAVIGLLQDNFKSELKENSRIARLHFTSTDAALSAEVANAFTAEYIQANLQRRFNSSAYARNFVSEQLEQARARLEASEREVNAYARRAGLIRTRDASEKDAGSRSSSVTAASLMQLNEAANRAKAERVAAESRWNAEREQPLLSSTTVLADPAVKALRERRDVLQAQAAEARARYLGGHPSIERLDAEVALVDRQLIRAATEARNSVTAQFTSAKSAEAQLREQVNALQGATLSEQDRSVRYNTLAREADTNRSIYEGLLQRFRELNASAGITSSNLTVIDNARPPSEPSSPKLSLNLALALVFGIVLAAIAIFLRDQLDDRVRVPEDVDAKVGLKLLGVIPKADSSSSIDQLSDAKSAISEAYSALRTSLLFSTPTGLPKLLLVTSAQASEGKSTTSYALASSFARIGKRVLLVDADLRRPSIHTILGVSNKQGLSDILVGTDTFESSVIRGNALSPDVIASGSISPNVAELLSSPAMAVFMTDVEQRYDFVVIDSAPVLGLADSPQLSALSDGVLMVIESDRAHGGQLKTALRRLRSMRPVLLGAVLTKFDARKLGNEYSSYYGHDYYRYETNQPKAA
jgi:polysaccharide biosynthesis transport protein